MAAQRQFAVRSFDLNGGKNTAAFQGHGEASLMRRSGWKGAPPPDRLIVCCSPHRVLLRVPTQVAPTEGRRHPGPFPQQRLNHCMSASLRAAAQYVESFIFLHGAPPSLSQVKGGRSPAVSGCLQSKRLNEENGRTTVILFSYRPSRRAVGDSASVLPDSAEPSSKKPGERKRVDFPLPSHFPQRSTHEYTSHWIRIGDCVVVCDPMEIEAQE